MSDVLAMPETPDGLRPFDPPFDFELKSANDYARLLAGEELVPFGEGDLRGEAARKGRVLLVGDGGSGKTSLMGRLWRQAKEDRSYACWIDLRKWSTDFAKEWEAIDEYSWGASLLLSRLGTPSTSEQDLELADLESILLLIDGVNEVPSPVAERILQTADYLASRHPNVGVVVSDRLVRRASVDGRWLLTRVAAARCDAAQSDDEMLRNAFFLNLTIREGLEAKTAGGAFHEYLRDHVGLDEAQVRCTAQAAADAYEEQAARSFPIERFRQVAGNDPTDRLLGAGQLIAENSHAYFAHQLFHDALAADWLAVTPDRWRKEGFDPLTFKASSFDVLALTLERIDDPPEVDTFLRRIYDWNYYGAAFTLARARVLGEVQLSPTMYIALLAMLAERQWDPMVATAEQVRDALRLIGDKLAHRMLNARQLDEVLELVAEQEGGDPAFESWRAIYLHHIGSEPNEMILEAVQEADSLLGWTAANVLRRTRPTAEAIAKISSLSREAQADVVRWRAAHVLGGWPCEESTRALQRSFSSDSDDWVRYGATRSLIDLAAADEQIRHDVIPWLSERLDQPSDRVIGEIERALVRRPVPPHWTRDVSVLVEALFSRAADERERDRWRRLASRLCQETED